MELDLFALFDIRTNRPIRDFATIENALAVLVRNGIMYGLNCFQHYRLVSFADGWPTGNLQGADLLAWVDGNVDIYG